MRARTKRLSGVLLLQEQLERISCDTAQDFLTCALGSCTVAMSSPPLAKEHVLKGILRIQRSSGGGRASWRDPVEDSIR